MATSGGITYSNSGTAVDDYFTLSADTLTGTWNVMTNDGGGTRRSCGRDDGTNNFRPYSDGWYHVRYGPADL